MKGLVMNFSKVHNKASLLLFLVVLATEAPESGARQYDKQGRFETVKATETYGSSTWVLR